ncbi:MAG: 50S ribosomal protein L23 [Candidatus Thermoplasmatota archaeon]|jgi:large subunit ribosomal protein L23|nr:50S ribosomal protein L23 [Candidatus Thermoplasmatota archaeon]
MKREIIISPVATEKSMLITERENKITFIVDRTANRKMIKEEVERMYSVKVTSVRTLMTKYGKKAIVTLDPEYSADELSGRIGIF